MKRMYLLLGMLMLVGAGCSSNVPEGLVEVVVEPEFEATEWYVGVENETWYAYRPYERSGDPFGIGKERTTNRANAATFFQNIDEPILLPGRLSLDGVDYYEGDDWVLLDILVYPEQARMPTDLELQDLDGRQVGVRRGNAFDAWYWKTNDKLYEIFYYTAEGSGVEVEDVLRTLIEQ